MTAPYADRVGRVQQSMAEHGVDVLLLSVGGDLPWLIGYEAMPLERVTMLVVPARGDATLVVPRLEAPRVAPDVPCSLEPWEETDDPIARIASIVGPARAIAIGAQTWAEFVIALQRELPGGRWTSATTVTAPLRRVKDADEIAALARAARAVDVIAVEMRDQSFIDRTERSVHQELNERMLAAGHERTNFAIVAAGENAASAHHEPGNRVIAAGDVVLLDFGGTMDGYCSDITRMYVVGEATDEMKHIYRVLRDAQEASVQAAVVGATYESVDAAARDAIAAAGFGEYFIHRTGHGIGRDAHEEPYVVAGNTELVEPGHAFSIEPGIYLPGRFGFRLEDIVVATDAGPQRLNEAPRGLAEVE
jgi:Xaa-Pro aminopeptidase